MKFSFKIIPTLLISAAFASTAVRVHKSISPKNLDVKKITTTLDNIGKIGTNEFSNEDIHAPSVNNQPRYVNTQNKKQREYSVEDRAYLLEFLITHFKGTAFDTSDDLYKMSFDVLVSAKKEDFMPLYIKYLEYFEKLKEAESIAEKLLAKDMNRDFKAEYEQSLKNQQAKLVMSAAKSVTINDKNLENKEKKSEENINSVNKDTVEDNVSTKMAQNKHVAKNDDFIAFDYGSRPKTDSKQKNPILAAAMAQIPKAKKKIRKTQERKFNSDLTIKIQKSFLKKGLGEWAQSFEVRADYSDAERFVDYGTGEITISKKLNSQMSIMSATILGSGLMDTKVDLVFDKNESLDVYIPMFDENNFLDYMGKINFSGYQGHLLIELDPMTDKVDLDSKYFKKLYLDKKLNPVKADGDYAFLLYVGVESGTTALRYTRNGNEQLSKIINIEPEKVYYELNHYRKMNSDRSLISQKNVLGSKTSDLNIDDKLIKNFNSFERVRQIGPNKYDFSISNLPLGTRKYLEFSHMTSPIYIGKWNQNKLVIPSESYMANLIESLRLNSIERLCLVKIDLPQRAKDHWVESKTGSEYMNLDRIYIDEEGNITEEMTPLTKEMILISDRAAQITANIKYVNESEDFINSYCSPGTVIIEKL